VLKLTSENSWPMPLVEIALLLDHGLRRHGHRDGCQIVVASEDDRLLPRFGIEVADQIEGLLRERDIEILTSMPHGRVAQLEGTLTFEAGPLRAHAIPGVPRCGDSGLFEPDESGRLAEHVFALGDATRAVYRTPATASLQARRIATEITGETLPDGEPATAIAQLFTPHGSLHLAATSADPFATLPLTRVAAITSSRLPDHFAGTYLSQLGLVDSPRAAERFCDSLPPAAAAGQNESDAARG
jgi:hypothetical protein